MSHFDDLSKFFQSKNISAAIKVAVPIVGLLICAWLIDITGICYRSDSRNLEQVLLINTILQDSILSINERQSLESLRTSVISRRSLTSRFFAITDSGSDEGDGALAGTPEIDETIYLTNFRYSNKQVCEVLDSQSKKAVPSHPIDSANIIDKKYTIPSIILDTTIERRYMPYTIKHISQTATNPVSKNKIISRKNIRSDFWFFVSSNFFLFIIAFLAIVAYLIGEDGKGNTVWLNMVLILAMSSLVCFVGLLSYWLYGLFLNIPIFGRWWVTYTLLAILSGIMTGFIVWAINKNTKT